MYVVDVDDVIKDTLEIVKKKLFSLGKKSMFLILSFPILIVRKKGTRFTKLLRAL